jgi:hypothetical protein
VSTPEQSSTGTGVGGTTASGMTQKSISDIFIIFIDNKNILGM